MNFLLLTALLGVNWSSYCVYKLIQQRRPVSSCLIICNPSLSASPSIENTSFFICFQQICILFLLSMYYSCSLCIIHMYWRKFKSETTESHKYFYIKKTLFVLGMYFYIFFTLLPPLLHFSVICLVFLIEKRVIVFFFFFFRWRVFSQISLLFITWSFFGLFSCSVSLSLRALNSFMSWVYVTDFLFLVSSKGDDFCVKS